MGDGGSHLLGGFLAAAALFSARSSTTHLVPVTAIPILLLLIPIFDTVFVTLARGLAGRSAFLGGRDHTSHRLVALGIGERRAVLVLYGLSFAGGAVALGLIGLTPGLAWALVGLYAMALVMIGLYLGHIESALETEIEPPLPTELTTRYRAYEVLLDVALLGLAYYLAYFARFREPEFSRLLPAFLSTFPIVVGLQLATLWISGKYRSVWAQIGPTELISLGRATAAGVAVSVIAVLYLTRFEGYSRLVFAFDALLAPVLIISARVTLIGLDQYLRRRRSRGRTAIIYGAGRGGALAVRELLQNASLGLTPIGFLDDDPGKRRLKMDGLPVLGGLADLEAILDRPRTRVSAVVVAASAVPAGHFDRLCDVCAKRDIAVRRIRFAIEDVRRRSQDQVVAFPRQPGVR
jgi:UDP-GlcNAc:undecaprenyl-phosphate GlcNAc-1-phosphate transferase